MLPEGQGPTESEDDGSVSPLGPDDEIINDDAEADRKHQILPSTIKMSDRRNAKPKIFLMGLQKSGKSSIQRVVFHKMAPNETVFLASTQKIEKSDVSECSFIKFQLWDFPGQMNFCDAIYQLESFFPSSCAVIFVIDAQNDYLQALDRLHETLTVAIQRKIDIKVEVFIHKVDYLNDEQKTDIQHDITQRVMSMVEDLSVDHPGSNLFVGFHLTTIYDHSIFGAFSKVVQRLIPHLNSFERLLDLFITNSMIEKAFVFDVATKIYLATDSNVIDMQVYELCCDMIDVAVDFAGIYNKTKDKFTAATTPTATQTFSEHCGVTITLNNDMALYLRGVNQCMALACIMCEESLDKVGLIEYNFQLIKTGLRKILEIGERQAAAHAASGSTKPDEETVPQESPDTPKDDESNEVANNSSKNDENHLDTSVNNGEVKPPDRQEE